MTDDRIKAVYEEYGRIVTGKEYALIHAIAEAVAPQRTWVGLDADEVFELASGRWTLGQMAVLVEAKLKEKNT